MAEQSPGHFVAVCASLLVVGCSASRQGPPGQYAQAKDSATQASVSRPQLAMPQVGEKMPVVPPLREECNEQVGEDSRGEPITRAMQLGVEQHQVALQCAEKWLRELKPRGFSLSPRYRYDSTTGKAEHIPRETVNELLKQGRSAELRGTLEPDVVIHRGAPHQVQAVYDFKFP